MAESGIQLPNDGPGKILRTNEVTIGGVDKEQQIVQIADAAGDDVFGSKTDTTWDGVTTNPSVIALLKAIWNKLTAGITVRRELGTTTVTQVNVSTLSSLVIGSRTTRKSLKILSSPSNTGIIYLAFNGPASPSSPTKLNPGEAYYETDAGDQIRGVSNATLQALIVYEVF